MPFMREIDLLGLPRWTLTAKASCRVDAIDNSECEMETIERDIEIEHENFRAGYFSRLWEWRKSDRGVYERNNIICA